jgi:hypothetical protein
MAPLLGYAWPAPVLGDLGIEDGAHRLGAIFLVAHVSAVPYLQLVVSKAPAGFSRLLLVVPLIAFNLAVGSCFNTEDEAVLRFAALFILSWLANFKVTSILMLRKGGEAGGGRGGSLGGWRQIQGMDLP